MLSTYYKNFPVFLFWNWQKDLLFSFPKKAKAKQVLRLAQDHTAKAEAEGLELTQESPKQDSASFSYVTGLPSSHLDSATLAEEMAGNNPHLVL